MKFEKSVQDKLMDQFIDGMIASMSECDEPELKNFGRLMIKRKEMTELERAACDIVIHGHDVEGMDMLTEVFNNICQELRMVNEMLEAVHKKEESI